MTRLTCVAARRIGVVSPRTMPLLSDSPGGLVLAMLPWRSAAQVRSKHFICSRATSWGCFTSSSAVRAQYSPGLSHEKVVGEQGDKITSPPHSSQTAGWKEQRHTLRNNCERALPRNCTQTRSYTKHTKVQKSKRALALAIAHDEA